VPHPDLRVGKGEDRVDEKTEEGQEIEEVTPGRELEARKDNHEGKKIAEIQKAMAFCRDKEDERGEPRKGRPIEEDERDKAFPIGKDDEHPEDVTNPAESP
jgi:hypothetical protein